MLKDRLKSAMKGFGVVAEKPEEVVPVYVPDKTTPPEVTVRNELSDEEEFTYSRTVYHSDGSAQRYEEGFGFVWVE